jgi:hypothetical protein
VVKASEDDDDPYVATARYGVEGGSIVESRFDEGDGVTVTRYNARHHVVSETLDADGPAPIAFAYDLDPVSDETTGTTMSCLGPSGPITQTVVLRPYGDHRAKAALIRDNCFRRR